MENKLPAIKVYDIDYSFIIKNYLNPEMWQKTWTLFAYKTFVITLNISSISCADEKVSFKIKIKDNNPDNKYYTDWGENTDKYSYDFVYYNLKTDNLKLLKQKIESEALKIIGDLERQRIKGCETYMSIEEDKKYEENNLTRIAENFLDENNVKNQEIRDVYIESYVDNNSKINTRLNKVLVELEYNVFTDLYLIFAQATKNEKLIAKIDVLTKNTPNIEQIKNEVREYIETEEFEEEMQDNLEEV